MKIVLPFLSILLAIGSLPPGERREQGASRDFEPVLFRVQKNSNNPRATIEAIAQVVSGMPVAVPFSCDGTNVEASKFESKYYKEGNTYRLIFGGSEAGLAIVGSPDTNYGAITVKLRTHQEIRDFVMGLATDSKSLGKKKGHRRAPTKSESEATAEIVKTIYRASGVPESALARLRIDQVNVSSLLNDDTQFLFATAVIERADKLGLEDSLFVIARESGPQADFKVEYSVAQHAATEVEGTEIVLVDHVDLDGDGIDEVVAELVYYENYRFQIYRRDNRSRTWRKIFETETLGCL